MNIVEMLDDALHGVGARLSFTNPTAKQTRRDLRKAVRSKNAIVFAFWEPLSLLWWAVCLCLKFVGAVLVLWLGLVLYASSHSVEVGYLSLGQMIHAYAASANGAAAIATDLRASFGLVLGGLLIAVFVVPKMVFSWRSPVDRYIDRHMAELVSGQWEHRHVG